MSNKTGMIYYIGDLKELQTSIAVDWTRVPHAYMKLKT